MVGGIVKNFRGRAVQWDVEMNAPLGSGFLLFRLAKKRFAEVAINKALAVRAANNDLMQIDVFREGGESFARCRRGADFQGGTDVKLADFDSVLHQTAERILRLFK